MKTRNSIVQFAIVSLIVFCLVPSIARSEHTIERINELISMHELASLTDNTGARLHLNEISANGAVEYKYVEGTFDLSDAAKDSAFLRKSHDNLGSVVRFPALEVRLIPTENNPQPSIKTDYEMRLPSFKRIQLEYDYQLTESIDQRYGSDVDFYIEVYSKDGNGDWHKAKSFKKSLNPKRKTEHHYKIRDHVYSQFSNVVNLSDWSGKEVKLSLVAQAKDGEKKEVRGRWLNATLVGATFDIRVVTD